MDSARVAGFAPWCGRAARHCAVVLGFSIPISVALDNVLLVLILVLWLLSLDYRRKFALLADRRIAWAALALFALLVAGVAYGTRAPGDGLHFLGKYADLALVPVFVTLFNNEQVRRRAWQAFAAAMALTLVLSYLMWVGVVGHNALIGGDPLVPAVFKKYLTQNLMMAYAALLFVCLAQLATSAKLRWLCYALAALATVNVALLVPGRTGQVVLILLAGYLIYSVWRWKGALAMMTLLAGVILFGGVNNRLAQTVSEWRDWQPGQYNETATGERLEFLRNSISIASEHPLAGNGTGSFPRLYKERIAGTGLTASDNPHNEYLGITIQTGIPGLLLLMFLFWCVWRDAGRLATEADIRLARGLAIMFAVGCLFNSLLMDHVEGLFFAWAAGLLFAGQRPAQPAAEAA